MTSTTNDHYQLGIDTLTTVGGTTSAEMLDSIRAVSPKAAEHVVSAVFGELYQGDDLSLRDRELASIASLASLGGCEPQLRVHVSAALNVGVTAEEVVETFVQLIPFAGMPRALNALFVAHDVLTEHESGSHSG
ncbi:4-carboxymuconolactone decarboxylase [Saccharopolyspora lacisalsi]|uniref:4-carboxymuconolactone decarboxylase n=1 Tax=Halosaccharopolyspora lacisalsi TaxID=1000566 RepID=A0A839E395_9PSEU|nr:carboxymuconolactone decarboxylase family protein [Halosaccharopolyspora lacisalsi]MBA8826235.1 4-carboxymuconolactone decarboxylase [Halosaccharopolyspora lacisalsi]